MSKDVEWIFIKSMTRRSIIIFLLRLVLKALFQILVDPLRVYQRVSALVVGIDRLEDGIQLIIFSLDLFFNVLWYL